MKKTLLCLSLLATAGSYQLCSKDPAAPGKIEKSVVTLDPVEYLDETIKKDNILEKIQRIITLIKKAPADFFTSENIGKIKKELTKLADKKNKENTTVDTWDAFSSGDRYVKMIEEIKKHSEKTKISNNFLKNSILRSYATDLKKLKELHKTGIMYYIAYKHIDKNKATKETNLATYKNKKVSNENELEKLKAIEEKKGSLTLWQKGRRAYYQEWLSKRNNQIVATNKWLDEYKSRKAKLKEEMDVTKTNANKIYKSLEDVNNNDLTDAINKIINTKKLNSLLDMRYLNKAKNLSK